MNELRLTEPVPIDDDLCSGIALIEEIDAGVRLVLFARQTVYETGETVHVVKRKIVLPLEAFESGHKAVGTFLSSRPSRRPLRVVD